MLRRDAIRQPSNVRRISRRLREAPRAQLPPASDTDLNYCGLSPSSDRSESDPGSALRALRAGSPRRPWMPRQRGNRVKKREWLNQQQERIPAPGAASSNHPNPWVAHGVPVGERLGGRIFTYSGESLRSLCSTWISAAQDSIYIRFTS